MSTKQNHTIALAWVIGCGCVLLAACTTESSGSRVFFVEPVDGSTVESPVPMKFGAENFIIEPVGDGAIHEGAGHLHLGVDADCLAPGQIIPKASPWIHFGDGSTEIEMQLEPGSHHLCLQVGDGEHRTLEGAGMTDEITITVSPNAAARR
ncbi:MAG: DUF4399 domain-containing protein [Acidobacteriota bacterium]